LSGTWATKPSNDATARTNHRKHQVGGQRQVALAAFSTRCRPVEHSVSAARLHAASIVDPPPRDRTAKRHRHVFGTRRPCGATLANPNAKASMMGWQSNENRPESPKNRKKLLKNQRQRSSA
jgi:hypothetical protein